LLQLWLVLVCQQRVHRPYYSGDHLRDHGFRAFEGRVGAQDGILLCEAERVACTCRGDSEA
jgi:hypothetical protein